MGDKDIEDDSGGNGGSGEHDNDRHRRISEHITIQDLKDHDIEATSTLTDHSSNKKRRQNSSICDNSLISTYNTIQERHFSQDSQVMLLMLLFGLIKPFETR